MGLSIISSALSMQSKCAHCGCSFVVREEDKVFLESVAPVFLGKKYVIPAPTLCPECRWQRRLSFRNERNLYHRKCDLSGRSMISMHPADTPFPVYHISEWLSDKWDAKDYGKSFDFQRPFFEQFHELVLKTPHFSAFVDPSMDVNSEYTNCSSEAKNCYLITQAEKNEDCYYSRGINNCRNCCDCLRVHKCELCYESINLRNCYHCLFSRDSDNCRDCFFSSELRGCKNCFGCHGLVQKEYYIFNKPVNKKEWEEKVGKLTLSHKIISDMIKRSQAVRLATPQRSARRIQCENSTGDDLLSCRNAYQCFDCNNLEDCAYCYELAGGAKCSQDFSMFGLNCELCYECSGGGYGMYHVLFSNHCWNNVSDLLYCESCFPGTKNCFGCFGLHRAEYCILNKQYTKEEYEALVPKIIEHMQKTKEWGEFFAPKISVYGYNESLAAEFFPLTKAEAQKDGWRWREEEDTTQDAYLGPDIVVPETIHEVTDDIAEKVLRCSSSKKLYRLTRQELGLYRSLGVPLPRLSPQERHLQRMSQRRPRTLCVRICDRCHISMESTYPKDVPGVVYCEECYLATLS